MVAAYLDFVSFFSFIKSSPHPVSGVWFRTVINWGWNSSDFCFLDGAIKHIWIENHSLFWSPLWLHSAVKCCRCRRLCSQQQMSSVSSQRLLWCFYVFALSENCCSQKMLSDVALISCGRTIRTWIPCFSFLGPGMSFTSLQDVPLSSCSTGAGNPETATLAWTLNSPPIFQSWILADSDINLTSAGYGMKHIPNKWYYPNRNDSQQQEFGICSLTPAVSQCEPQSYVSFGQKHWNRMDRFLSKCLK